MHGSQGNSNQSAPSRLGSPSGISSNESQFIDWYESPAGPSQMPSRLPMQRTRSEDMTFTSVESISPKRPSTNKRVRSVDDWWSGDQEMSDIFADETPISSSAYNDSNWKKGGTQFKRRSASGCEIEKVPGPRRPVMTPSFRNRTSCISLSSALELGKEIIEENEELEKDIAMTTQTKRNNLLHCNNISPIVAPNNRKRFTFQNAVAMKRSACQTVGPQALSTPKRVCEEVITSTPKSSLRLRRHKTESCLNTSTITSQTDKKGPENEDPRTIMLSKTKSLQPEEDDDDDSFWNDEVEIIPESLRAERKLQMMMAMTQGRG